MSMNSRIEKMGNYTSSIMAENLRNDLKSFISGLGYNGDDIVSKMKTKDLIPLKKIVSSVNNILAVKAAEVFVEKLEEYGFIKEAQKKGMLTKLSNTNPNAKGYDVQYDGKNEEKKILAEVKCNIPKDKKHFGENKDSHIKKDIKHLFDGKNGINTNDYYKFFVVMKCDDIETCMEGLIESFYREHEEKRDKIKLYKRGMDLNEKYVYVVFVSID